MGLFTTLLIYDATKAGAKKVKKSFTLSLIVMMSLIVGLIKLTFGLLAVFFKLFFNVNRK